LQNIEFTPEEIESMMNNAKEQQLADIRDYAGQLVKGEA
jgi:hypothetical protein